jgi:hypothetical protein
VKRFKVYEAPVQTGSPRFARFGQQPLRQASAPSELGVRPRFKPREWISKSVRHQDRELLRMMASTMRADQIDNLRIKSSIKALSPSSKSCRRWRLPVPTFLASARLTHHQSAFVAQKVARDRSVLHTGSHRLGWPRAAARTHRVATRNPKASSGKAKPRKRISETPAPFK